MGNARRTIEHQLAFAGHVKVACSYDDVAQQQQRAARCNDRKSSTHPPNYPAAAAGALEERFASAAE